MSKTQQTTMANKKASQSGARPNTRTHITVEHDDTSNTDDRRQPEDNVEPDQNTAKPVTLVALNVVVENDKFSVGEHVAVGMVAL